MWANYGAFLIGIDWHFLRRIVGLKCDFENMIMYISAYHMIQEL